MENTELIIVPKVSGGVYGVSCILHTLQDVIDYEEKRRVPEQGYPRFIPHPFVAKIQQQHKRPGFDAFAVQNQHAANHVVNHFVSPALASTCQIEAFKRKGNSYAILHVPVRYAQQLSEDITNSGIVLNARKAHRILSQVPVPEPSGLLETSLSQLEKGSNPAKTWCFNSGMAAIYCTVLSLLKPGKRAVVIGSCYTDSHKIFRKLSERHAYEQTLFLEHFRNDAFPVDTGLVFLEIPTNPLLQVEDLRQIVTRAHAVGAEVLVDSTIASPWHYSPFEFGADWIVHSSTKSLSGKNNHLGGVLFANPGSPNAEQKIQAEAFAMNPEESSVLEHNLNDFPERIARMAENAAVVTQFLQNHPQIARVFSPQGLKNGNGHVVSFRLKNESEQRATAFYDHCTITIKGPSMGFEKSMLMPYALITRYFDSDSTLESLGLSRYLMRLSVGAENVKNTLAHLVDGLNKL
ncbi:PLP-dependent transferase [Gaoshiqia sediminis]|uniref:PLP-dependent transferase n=1 Tax=Gaoshiqia sediminis TaxID=2986998 RepID=A0AA42C9C1_9BACT|nr:PLP-dependent transferase [Gaoshiqia sediminis]MCW0482297.1 PLP-dependent transferase [Gaoshiqia sediminis]